jgi:pimeloyl-ACP methyl ester carboxylesterase
MPILRRVQDLNFTIVVTLASRYFALRDRLLGRIKPVVSSGIVERHTIDSGKNSLDAVFVAPAEEPPRAALLICHGIGETVENWLGVQHLLAEQGIATLVFDYSGYGRSTGSIRASQCEQDALCAFRFLRHLLPSLPASILGFSLGSGVAVAISGSATARRLVICAAYTSIRDAALQVGIPRFLGFIVPPIWDSRDTLRSSHIPVLVVHGKRDRLFPVKMAQALAAACGGSARLSVMPGVGHDDPYDRPESLYWREIGSFLLN